MIPYFEKNPAQRSAGNKVYLTSKFVKCRSLQSLFDTIVIIIVA